VRDPNCPTGLGAGQWVLIVLHLKTQPQPLYNVGVVWVACRFIDSVKAVESGERLPVNRSTPEKLYRRGEKNTTNTEKRERWSQE